MAKTFPVAAKKPAAKPTKKPAAKRSSKKTVATTAANNESGAEMQKNGSTVQSNNVSSPPQTAENGVNNPQNNIESFSGTNQDPIETKRPITVVIPYLHSAAKGKELIFALRAWEKNFKEDFEIVIIGDKPEFVADHVLHLESVVLAGNPQLDVAAKLMQAIASFLVSDDFILANDDIYPVNTITLGDIKHLRCSGILGETKAKAGSAYLEKLNRTKELLNGLGLSDYDFATHLPVLYNKHNLAEVIEKFGADKEGLLISSLYFNQFLAQGEEPEVTKGGLNGDHVVYVYRENPREEVIKDGFANRKFVNHNNAGYMATLPFLVEAFPEKSSFEK